jgi:hypothetical protein
MKKLRDLGSQKNRNILEFEIDEILSNRQLLTLKALNSFSLRSFSFIVPVGKRFINLFFRLLDFPGKSAEIF